MRPLRDGDVDRVVQGVRRIRRRVDHDLRAAAQSIACRGDDVLRLHVDGDVRAEPARQGELLGVAGETRDGDSPRAGRAGGDHAAEAPLAGPEDHDAVGRPGARDGAGPR